MVNKIKVTIISLSVFFLNTSNALAQGTLQNPLRNAGIENIGDLIEWLINTALLLAGLAAAIGIIISGYQMIFAGDSPSKIEDAKNRLKWSVIGLVVILLAGTIVRIVVSATQGNI